ncbi:TetR/AcrR family transcriptional regulator [Aurantiacibacter flavus]|uniref:TetR/AcrR family transcriptional regulator n=1 Tax=Aurantiacibacter flavus TaxID=3145232 RepID=A0ABV0CZC8_9SPHN
MTEAAKRSTRRLSRPERRRQLLDTALAIVRDEGADRLTLGHLAASAGVSKPIAYDHFITRSGVLIALYKMIDAERVETFRAAMASRKRTIGETVDMLASAYIRCAGDMTDEFHVVGAALTASDDKAVIFQELLDNNVEMFLSVLQPRSTLSRSELKHRCVGLVGAGEALSTLMVRGGCDETEAIQSFAALIHGALAPSLAKPD